jgi:hypothetical protein
VKPRRRGNSARRSGESRTFETVWRSRRDLKPARKRYSPRKPRILFGYLEFLAGTSLWLRLSREHPASEEKTLRGGDEFQPRVRVTEPGAELQQQCQDHKEDYQLGAFDQSRRVVDELRTAALERCAGGQEHCKYSDTRCRRGSEPGNKAGRRQLIPINTVISTTRF